MFRTGIQKAELEGRIGVRDRISGRPGRHSPTGISASDAFLNAGRSAHAVSEIVELGSTDFAASHDLDFLNQGRMQREAALDADAVRNPPHGIGFVNARTPAFNDYSFKNLNTLALAFPDFHVNFDGVARSEFRYVVS
jgi:hypothetical protein